MTLGVIAEDLSDVAVIKRLTAKVIPEREFSTKHFVGNGCGKLRRKCRAWVRDLSRRGCTHIVIVHDLDDADERELRPVLEECIDGVPVRGSLVLIPVREIEAWLLADAQAIKKVFNLQSEPVIPQNPELLPDPKRSLEDLVWRAGNKRYVNSIHNERLAEESRLGLIEKCRSFRAYPQFLRRHRGAA